jgi:hypothetical protein
MSTKAAFVAAAFALLGAVACLETTPKGPAYDDGCTDGYGVGYGNGLGDGEACGGYNDDPGFRDNDTGDDGYNEGYVDCYPDGYSDGYDEGSLSAGCGGDTGL